MKDYYSPKEVSEILSVNRKTILSLINLGKIQAVNIAVGSRSLYRIPKEELDKFLNNSQKYGKHS